MFPPTKSPRPGATSPAIFASTRRFPASVPERFRRIHRPPPVRDRDPQGSDRLAASRALQQGGQRARRSSCRPAPGAELTARRGRAASRQGRLRVLPAFSIDGYKDVTVPSPPPKSPKKSSSTRSSSCANRAPRWSRSKKTARWPTATGRKSATRARLNVGEQPKATPKPQAQPIAGEDTLVEIGGKDTVEAFNNALRGAKPGQELKVEVSIRPITPSPSWPAKPLPTTSK